MMNLLALSILNSGVPLSMVCAVIGLAFAFFLIAAVMRAPSGNERMREISAAVQEGARAYLNRQVKTISVIAVIIFVLLFIFKDHSTAIGFVIGAFCSLAAGFIGMRVAVLANVRTAQAAGLGRLNALRMAFNGGSVTGLLVVGLALLSVAIFYTIAAKLTGSDAAIRSLVGLALGGSLISVFARLGGGIYTKAADVGADLVGKIESGLGCGRFRNLRRQFSRRHPGGAADAWRKSSCHRLSVRAWWNFCVGGNLRNFVCECGTRQTGSRVDGRGNDQRADLCNSILAGHA